MEQKSTILNRSFLEESESSDTLNKTERDKKSANSYFSFSNFFSWSLWHTEKPIVLEAKKVTKIFDTLNDCFADLGDLESEPQNPQPIQPKDSKPKDSTASELTTPLLATETSESPTASSPLPNLWEIRKLSISELKDLFSNTAQVAAVSIPHKKKFALLCTITLGAAIMDMLYSYLLRENIEENGNFWFSGGSSNPSKGVAEFDYTASWAFAAFSLVVDFLSVNPIEESYAALQSKLPALKDILKNFPQWMFITFHKLLLFLPISIILASSDLTGLSDLTGDNNKNFSLATGIPLVGLGTCFYWMFLMGSLERHLNALIDFFCNLEPSQWSLDPRKWTYPSLEKTTAMLEMFRIVASNWSYRGLSTLYFFERLFTGTLGMKNLKPEQMFKWMTTIGALGFYLTIMTRTLQTATTFLNPKFTALKLEEIKQAKVSGSEQATNLMMALVSGGSNGLLAYVHGPENASYSAIFTAGIGLVMGAITYVGSNYRSTRQAALRDKEAKEINPKTNFTLQMAAMASVEELFDQIIILMKTAGLTKLVDYLNKGARVSRVAMLGGSIESLVKLFADYGLIIPIQFLDQIALTLGVGIPQQLADTDVYNRELMGGRDDAGGYIPYLLAKWHLGAPSEAIKAYGIVMSALSAFFTPKKLYNWEKVFKAWLELNPEAMEQYKQLHAKLRAAQMEAPVSPSVTPTFDYSLMAPLRKGVKGEFDLRLKRLTSWFLQQPQLLLQLHTEMPAMSPILKQFEQVISPKPAAAAEEKRATSPEILESSLFKTADVPALKQIEIWIYQKKVGEMLDSSLLDSWLDTNPVHQQIIAHLQSQQSSKPFKISYAALTALEDFNKNRQATISSDYVINILPAQEPNSPSITAYSENMHRLAFTDKKTAPSKPADLKNEKEADTAENSETASARTCIVL